MIEMFAIESFQLRVGDRFHVSVMSGGKLDLELTSVRSLVDYADSLSRGTHRKPFSLSFIGPEGVRLPQGTYHFEHDELGEFDVFIVPIGRQGNQLTFEAIYT